MTVTHSSAEPFNVLIVGGGVAGLEAALALRDLGGILTITSAHCEVPEPGRVAINPGARHDSRPVPRSR